MKLDCKIDLFDVGDGNKIISPAEIFDNVKSMKKYEITYSDADFEQKSETDNKTRKLKTEKGIESVSGCGLYFILSADDKLLYFGKAQDLNARLTQHLIECSRSTHSHIQDVSKYLQQQKKQKSKTLKIQYCVINTVNKYHNAAIEGVLLDYISENRIEHDFLVGCWNKRHD